MNKMPDSIPVTPVQSVNVSETCKNHLLKTVEHFFRGSPWAVSMMDSITKLPESLMEGNVIDFGNYEECINVKVNEKWGSFTGRHCLGFFIIDGENLKGLTEEKIPEGQEVPLGFSLCVPSTCSPGEVQYSLNRIHNGFTIDAGMCAIKDPPFPFETSDWIITTIFAIIGLLCLLSTIYQLIIGTEEKCPKLVQAFSWYSNGKKLFSTSSNTNSMDVLHGIRFMSIFWIAIAHSVVYTKGPGLNTISHIANTKDLWHMVAPNAMYGVDTFFLMSGLLLGYNFLKTLNQRKTFNLPLFYLHRFLRVAPVLAAVILLHITVFPRVQHTSVGRNMATRDERNTCLKSWWATLFFIQNYYHDNLGSMCATLSWYLSVDMQLYWISPPILLLLHKRPKAGVITIIVGCLIGIIINFQNAYFNKIDPDIYDLGKNFHYSSYKTHIRFIPWLMGVLLGYIVYATQDWRAKVAAGVTELPKVYVACGWIGGMGCLIATYVSIHPFIQPDYKFDLVQASFFAALSKPMWSLGLMWLIFACISGYGGILNTILSWNFFHPLSRLTFCIYLLHIDILFTIIFSSTVPPYINDEYEAAQIAADMFLTVLAATALSLTVEAPFMQLETLILSGKGKKKKSPPISTSSTMSEIERSKSKKKDNLMA